MKANKEKIVEPIDFKKISEETGVRQGRIFYSDTFKSWAVSGSAEVDIVLIDSPRKIGDEIKDGIISHVRIDNNCWVYEVEK